MASPFPCCPVNHDIREKNPLIKKKEANSALRHVRTHFRSMMSEERLNSFMTDILIIKKTVHYWQSKSMDWFLCDRDLRHERVNALLLVFIHRDIYSLIMRQNN